MRLQDPTAAYSRVVADRRRSRAALDAERFRLGVHGLDCGSTPSTRKRALVGASSWALKADHVEETVRRIGAAGGLLADLGFQVCPIGADDAMTARPSIVVWVCGNRTREDEYEQLEAMSVPGISLGSCVEGLDEWSYLEDDEI